ncbi:MAG: YraN family protein [Comamonas sp.]|nr:YraN family protein [Comamonas sp.]
MPILPKKIPAAAPRQTGKPARASSPNSPSDTTSTTKAKGQAAEEAAWQYLQAQGLRLLQRNYRAPGRGGGEIDLICQTPDGTVVFVEVRSRRHSQYGGALASIGASKQRRIVQAARYWLLRQPSLPPCRFDVLALDNGQLQWLPGAFEAAS